MLTAVEAYQHRLQLTVCSLVIWGSCVETGPPPWNPDEILGLSRSSGLVPSQVICHRYAALQSVGVSSRLHSRAVCPASEQCGYCCTGCVSDSWRQQFRKGRKHVVLCHAGNVWAWGQIRTLCALVLSRSTRFYQRVPPVQAQKLTLAGRARFQVWNLADSSWKPSEWIVFSRSGYDRTNQRSLRRKRAGSLAGHGLVVTKVRSYR